MSKKNNMSKRKKHHEYQIRMEKEAEAEAKKRQVKREKNGDYQAGKVVQKKRPKVEPVVAADPSKKAAKKSKMALAKQLKGLSIDKKAATGAGIHNRKMSDSEDSDAAMDVDQVGSGVQSKSIKKKKPLMSRATFLELKKAQKRLVKSGGV